MKCQFILRIIITMQVAHMKFPPLPYKPLSKLKLHPTVMTLLVGNRAPSHKKGKTKCILNMHDEDSA